MEYIIKKTGNPPELKGDWKSEVWKHVETLNIDNFRTEGSDHRPITQAKLLYDQIGIYLFYSVQDQYVLSVRREYQEAVCKDSCAEFFLQPFSNKGYFNFEINCGGTLLLRYSTSETGNWEEKTSIQVPFELSKQIKIYHSMPKVVEPEIIEPTEWNLEYFIPFSILEHYVGNWGEISGQRWRSNFYKCGDETSHPHWASWSPVGGKLNFHQPEYFGELVFE